MSETTNEPGVEIFSTCPPIHGEDRSAYASRVASVARWSERAGCRGILVYTDNSLPDPWLVSQIILQSTETLCPLVAVQPVYLHPYTVAKMVTSVAYLHERRLYLNMVAGGFTNDLAALDDTTPHDRRYARLVEYTGIIRHLLAGGSPVTFAGEYYRVTNLKLTPPLPERLFPGIVVSGSSEAGQAAARAMGAIAIHYPKPAHEYAAGATVDGGPAGIRVGIIGRERGADAWEVAHARFPVDRRGQLAHGLAMKVSDSIWHRQLSDMGQGDAETPYWLVPFQNYKTFCPYLVGSYDVVAAELAAYIAAGYRTFILDVPATEEELDHIGITFARALARPECRSYCTTG
jgi:alkanesulfonate monooxygenase